MAMVDVASGSLQTDSQPGSFSLVCGSAAAWHATVPHSSYEPELAVVLSYDYSTINIVIIIIF